MPNVKNEMINGVFWSAVEKYSGLIVGILVSMVLARILSPNEYGVVAIATVLIHFLQMFCTMGIGPAIIQRNDLDKNDLNSIFTFSLMIGLFLALLFFCGSWPISVFYDNKLLIPICQILSIQVFFAAANMVPNALMNKNKRFKDIARRTLLLQISSGIFSIIAALKGAGVYALLISPIICAIGIFLWNRRFYKLSVDFHCSLKPMKKIFSYSIYQFLFEFFNYFSRNLDKLIIGKYIGTSPLGIYEKSYRLMQMPLNNVTSVIHPVLQPVMSSFQNDLQEMARKYNKIIAFVATISFPVAVTLYYCGDEVIHIFYGGKWDAAIPVFKILSLSIPTQMILSTSGGIWQSANATKYMFWTGMCNTLLTISCFIIGAYLYNTIEAIAWGWTLSSIVNFMNTYTVMYVIKFKSSLFKMLSQLIAPAINTVILICVFSAFQRWFPTMQILVSLCAKLFFATVVTVVSIQLLGVYDIKKILKKRIM